MLNKIIGTIFLFLALIYFIILIIIEDIDEAILMILIGLIIFISGLCLIK